MKRWPIRSGWTARGIRKSRSLWRNIWSSSSWSGQREKNPFQLSMGQKRRLSVAATIIQGQRLILLDEPTFGLDSKNTFALLEFLESYRKKGAVILMVTHDEVLSRNYGTTFWSVADGEITGHHRIGYGHADCILR